MVAVLLEAGADIEASAYYDRGTLFSYKGTPLHAAAWWGRADVVAVLLEAGAYVQAQDNNGRTPRDRARANKHYKVANMLKRAETKGHSPLPRLAFDNAPIRRHVDAVQDVPSRGEYSLDVLMIKFTAKGSYSKG